MTEIELTIFIKNNNVEITKTYSGDTNLCIDSYLYDNFCNLLGDAFFEDGVEVKAFNNYIVFSLEYICDYFGITKENIH